LGEESNAVVMLTVATAVAAAAFTGLQWWAARSQARQAETQLSQALVSQWRSLERDWQVALMLAIGPGGYYVTLPVEDQRNFVALHESYGAAGHYYFDSLGKLESATAAELGITPEARAFYEALGEAEQRTRLHEVATSIDRILDFMFQASGGILDGRLRVGTVYESFGIRILNNAASVRKLLREDYYSGYLFSGIAERVLALVDLLWAYAVAVGDVQESNGQYVARHKQSTGSGAMNRLRVRNLCMVRGAHVRAYRLEWLLTAAEVSSPRGVMLQRLRTWWSGHPLGEALILGVVFSSLLTALPLFLQCAGWL